MRCSGYNRSASGVCLLCKDECGVSKLTNETDERRCAVCDVRGRVQGVGYRAFVHDEARRLGLRGYVRNTHEPRQVEVVACGDAARIAQLIARLRVGPPMAHVESVSVAWQPDGDDHADFSIRY